MQIINKRSVVAATAAAVLMFGSMTPAVFAEDITITGNGQGSSNTTNVSAPQTTSVSQSNSANITNNVTSEANSGDNHANGNTGGSVSVGTGAASSTVSVTNKANLNVADPSSCGCQTQDGSVTISGNGEHSFNTANLSAPDSHTTTQSNSASITNNVNNEASTGDNHANGNTGGTVSVTTGSATATTTLSNMANANISGGSSSAGAGGAGTLSVKILGNGQRSVNTINLAVPDSTSLSQSNNGYISNYVENEAESGDNHANSNTGGDTSITAGAATSTVDITNMANFNSADIDCGCVMDLTAKIGQNGEMTSNTINAGMGNTLALAQANGGHGIKNYVDPEASSGDNGISGNTVGGSIWSDPSITTQPATSHVTLNNSGNANMIGSSMPMITLPGGTSLSFSFDFNAMLAMLGMH